MGNSSHCRSSRPALAALVVLAACSAARAPITPPAPVAPATVAAAGLPNRAGSLRFAVIGDSGTGQSPQYEVAQEMARWHEQFPFALVLMLGDNIYGSQRPADFIQKFARPYGPLLDAGVLFYASLGNHDTDEREQTRYPAFHMDGRSYYSVKAPAQDVRFFALDSSRMDAAQLAWLRRDLAASTEAWKIAFFHHPLYSSGRRHGSTVALREQLEPLFIQYHVSVVLSGHDHVYERIKPQHGIAYFVEGASGQLRAGNLRHDSPLTARGDDQDRSFMLMEIDGHELHFATITRLGTIVDSGVIQLPVTSRQ
ncbi:MAG TPA: metallophosphoesterase [Vicinamibacterales bacterium]|nr:metallophosphoesterase [Vicinamibacterales bacterium]